MKLHHPTAEIFVPDAKPLPVALRRITHLGIGAHPDDLEFMAFHGIVQCHASRTRWFGGITCTDGAGSARTGAYRKFDDRQMKAIRRREQNAAAALGRYGVMIQLDHPSRALKDHRAPALMDDLKTILAATRPDVVYTHNPADKHETHIAVMVEALSALRELPRQQRPQKVWGCEVWRDLDWLPDADKVLMNVSGHDRLAARLNRVFKSQIGGGKRYDLATQGRRMANATFFDPHAADASTRLIFGMDLTPLVVDETIDPAEYVCRFIERFRDDVKDQLRRPPGRL